MLLLLCNWFDIKEYICFWFRTFLDCEEVKSVISIGCCYNLLSEEGFNHVDSQCGFPMSFGVKSTCFSLGKCLLDLACQVNLYLGFLFYLLHPVVLLFVYIFGGGVWMGKNFTFFVFVEQYHGYLGARFIKYQNLRGPVKRCNLG